MIHQTCENRANGRRATDNIEAGHSFLNRNRGLTAFVLARIFNLGYHGPSAEDAWRRILSFFDTHLSTAREPQDQA